MEISVITTTTKSSFDSYAYKMLSTFLKYWPKDIKIYLYLEDFLIDETDRMKIFNLHEKIPNLLKFKERNQSKKYLCGYRDENYNVLYDFVKFSNKSYVMVDAIRNINSDVIIWIDADVITHSKVNQELFSTIIKKDCYVSYLGRGKLYTETGFIVFNKSNNFCLEHVDIVEKIYENNDYEMIYEYSKKNYTHAGYTDCHVFDYTKDKLVKKEAKVFDIVTTTKILSPHPLINSVLGLFFDHAKGDRKKEIKSLKKDIIWGELLKHPYWKEIFENG